METETTSLLFLPSQQGLHQHTGRLHGFLSASLWLAGPLPTHGAQGPRCFFVVSPWLLFLLWCTEGEGHIVPYFFSLAACRGSIWAHQVWGPCCFLAISPQQPAGPQLVHREWGPHCFLIVSLSGRSAVLGFLVFAEFPNSLSPGASSLSSEPSCVYGTHCLLSSLPRYCIQGLDPKT